jgi:hypothetical protein
VVRRVTYTLCRETSETQKLDKWMGKANANLGVIQEGVVKLQDEQRMVERTRIALFIMTFTGEFA